MAIAPSKTQQELYEKLSNWVPTWFFEQQFYQEAVFQSIAKMWEAMDLSIAELEDMTYICRSIDEYLEEHAFERNVRRQSGESDPSLQDRTKNIVNQSNCPALKSIVDNLLCTGESIFIEADGFAFFDRDAFFNRGDIFATKKYNYFYIVIPEQVVPGLEDFHSRDCFYSRDCFFSARPRTVKQEVYDAITAQVNKSKACGTLYFVVVTS